MQPAYRDDLHEFVLINTWEEEDIIDSKTADRDDK